jgi:hypothetical protein
MKLGNAKAKPELCVSKDKQRPVLTHLYLRIVKGRGKSAKPVGTLEATDSYRAVRLPVTLDDGDTEGFIPADVYKAARKLGGWIQANDSLVTADGTTYPRPALGQWPKLEQLWPAETAELEVGLNALFLWELAQALGSEQVRLRFMPTEDGDPDNGRAILVEPLRGDGVAGGQGLLMPIKLSVGGAA